MQTLVYLKLKLEQVFWWAVTSDCRIHDQWNLKLTCKSAGINCQVLNIPHAGIKNSHGDYMLILNEKQWPHTHISQSVKYWYYFVSQLSTGSLLLKNNYEIRNPGCTSWWNLEVTVYSHMCAYGAWNLAGCIWSMSLLYNIVTVAM